MGTTREAFEYTGWICLSKKGRCLESIAKDLRDILNALYSDIEEVIIDNMINGEYKPDLRDEELEHLEAIHKVLDKIYDMEPEIEALIHSEK